MCHCKTRPHQEFDDEVSVSHSPQAVFCDGLEAEFFSEELTRDNEGIPGQCTASKRKDGYPGHQLFETLEVRVKGESMRQKEMRPADWLPTLNKRKNRQDQCVPYYRG